MAISCRRGQPNESRAPRLTRKLNEDTEAALNIDVNPSVSNDIHLQW